MSLFTELKRRNVFRVAAAYLVIGWLLTQVSTTLEAALNLPPWFDSFIVSVLLIGFPLVLFFTWAYEITPEGVKKETEVNRDASLVPHTAKKLDMITLAGVLGVVGLFIYQQMNPPLSVFPADDYRDVGGRVTQDAKTEAGIQSDDAKELNPRNQLSSAQALNGEDSMLFENGPERSIDNKSLAVLPFANMANNAENEPFTVGLHDDLLTHLSKISALKVISRTSVMEYRDTTKKIKDIAQELGVANILEGGVQRAGNKIRLNVQLIDAETDEHIWAEIYDQELTTDNIFEIQTEISEKIAAALKAQLTAAESKSLAEKPTDNLEAYDAYLKARQLLEKRTSTALKEARSLYQRAYQLDPNYALAYAGEAFTLRLLNEYSDMPQEQSASLSWPLIDKALTLSPLLAEAHLANAAQLDESGDFKEAEKAYKLSMSINPNMASIYHWYGHMLRTDLGRAEEALVLHQKAAALDPLSNVILANIGWTLRANHRFKEALNQFEKIHQRDPNYPGALNGMAWVNDDLGNFAQAIIEQTKAINLDKGNLLNRIWLARHYLTIGNVASAKTVLAQIREISPEYTRVPVNQSMIEMIEGDYSSPQKRFQNLVEQNPDNRFYQSDLATFSVINNDCAMALQQWKQLSPEKFTINYQVNSTQVYADLAIAWCLKQSNIIQKAERLLAGIEANVRAIVMDGGGYFYKVGLLAIQGKHQEAANTYADMIHSNATQGWYWVDHLPYYADMRQEPIFIQARKQLMQDLAEQRELLKELQAEKGMQ